MLKPLAKRHSKAEFFEMSATKLVFEGGRVVGQRLVPDSGYYFERDEKNDKAVFLRKQAGGGPGVSVVCVCAAEGGSCAPAIIGEGGTDEFAVCVPDGGCGSSGILCFMEFGFAGGLTLLAKV